MLDLSKLQHDGVVEYRLGVAGASNVNWRSWKRGPIVVERRTNKLPATYRGPAGKIGDITCLTPRNESWAEYTQDDYDPTHDTWAAEDYYMQIREATP